jgi:hypothetical protein
MSTEAKPVATILAIDPGEHIGWSLASVFRVPKDYESGSETGIFTEAGIKGWAIAPRGIGTHTVYLRDAIEWLNGILGAAEDLHRSSGLVDGSPLFCMVEHFTFTQKSTLGGSRAAVEITGAIKALIGMNHRLVQIDTRQTPSEAKTVSLDTLRNLQFYSRGDKQADHALMAARHTVLAVRRLRLGTLSPNYSEMRFESVA